MFITYHKWAEQNGYVLNDNNDAFNMLFHEELHKERVEQKIKIANMLNNTYTIDMLKFVETQKNKFFIAR